MKLQKNFYHQILSGFRVWFNKDRKPDKIEELDKEYTTKRELAFEFGKKYRDKFNKVSIAKNILSIKK